MYSFRAKRITWLRLITAGCLLLGSMLGVALVKSKLAHSSDDKSDYALSLQMMEKGAPVSTSDMDAQQAKRQPSLSRLPPDVVRDYSYNGTHLLNGAGAPLYAADERYAQFLTRLRQFPPDILIVGKEAPFTHSLGPILSFGGENKTFPVVANRKTEDPRRLLTPDELQLRIKAVERFVQDVHSAGVKTVIPYISPMTAFGSSEKRQGFFQFFDSWKNYEQRFELGTRPAADPIDWTQQDKKGEVYFRMGRGKEDAGGQTRYSMCINNPDWHRWQMLIARWIARVGYDGVWMDNVLVHRCYDKYCQAVAKEMGVDLFREPNRVWLESYLRYFNDLRSEGTRLRGKFFLGGNYIDLPFQRTVTDKLDLSMVEQVWLGASRILWPGGVWTGYYPAMPNQRVLLNRTKGTIEERVFNNLWLVQLAYALRGERGVHLLAGAPAGKTPEFAHNEDSGILALAEAATFGGGTAVQIVGQSPFHSDRDLGAHKARQRFFSFARAHRELYEQLLPAGDIAIIVFPDQEVAALVEAQQVHEALLWRGLLVDVLDGDKQSAATLQKYRLVVVPGRPALPQWMKELPLLPSPDPLSTEEVRDVKKTFQKERGVPQLRQTRLSGLAVQRAEALRALVLPPDSLIEGCAWANDHRMVLHLLNFRVPIGLANGGKVSVVSNLPVQLKLPKGKKVRLVRIYSTGKTEASSVAFRQNGDSLEFKLEAVGVYEVCEIIFS